MEVQARRHKRDSERERERSFTMGAEHVVAGVVAFSLTKKLVILGTVNLYGVGRLYRHALKAARRTQTTSFPSSCPVAPVWRTPIAEGFKVRMRHFTCAYTCRHILIDTVSV